MARVLLVDDSPLQLTILRHMNAFVGHEIMTAATGEEAIVAAASAPDVVVLDAMLPDMSASDVLEAIRAAAPGAHVASFTAQEDCALQADSRLSKDGDLEALEAQLAALMPRLTIA